MSSVCNLNIFIRVDTLVYFEGALARSAFEETLLHIISKQNIKCRPSCRVKYMKSLKGL